MAAVTLLLGQEEARDIHPGEQLSVLVLIPRADPCSVFWPWSCRSHVWPLLALEKLSGQGALEQRRVVLADQSFFSQEPPHFCVTDHTGPWPPGTPLVDKLSADPHWSQEPAWVLCFSFYSFLSLFPPKIKLNSESLGWYLATWHQGYNQNHPLHLSRDAEHTVCYCNQDKARAFKNCFCLFFFGCIVQHAGSWFLHQEISLCPLQ